MHGHQLSAHDLSSLRILIVEDEPLLALTLQDFLSDAGFVNTLIAGKLEKALSLIENDDCDAAIVDANLAGISAGPVATALKKRGIPFLATSGYSSKQLPREFDGANFLPKPYTAEELTAAINALINSL